MFDVKKTLAFWIPAFHATIQATEDERKTKYIKKISWKWYPHNPSLGCCTSTRLDIYIHADQNSRAASTINLTLLPLARCPWLNPTPSELVCQAAPVSSVAWAQEERIESKKETPRTVKVQLPLPKKPQSLEVIVCQSHLWNRSAEGIPAAVQEKRPMETSSSAFP